MKKTPLMIVGLSLCAVSTQALDPDALALNLRKNLGLDTRTTIQVSTGITPSGIGNLDVVNVFVQGAPYPVFIDKKGEKYVIGGVVGDATVDPDADRAALISLGNVHSQGSPKAPVTIVEFSDFQCSHCKVAHETLRKELYKAYTKDQVRLVFKHFPLGGHAWAEPAAVAAECAAQQKEEAFWGMNDFFFSNQAKISTGTVNADALRAAQGLKLNAAAFEKCLSQGPALERVRADKKEGAALGVSSTPSVYINGRLRRGFRDFEDIKVVVEEKLKEMRN